MPQRSSRRVDTLTCQVLPEPAMRQMGSQALLSHSVPVSAIVTPSISIVTSSPSSLLLSWPSMRCTISSCILDDGVDFLLEGFGLLIRELVEIFQFNCGGYL